MSTKTNTVYKMIHKISGKNQPTPLKHLIKNNTQVTNINDIANTLAETSANSSSTNPITEFPKCKDKKEKQKLHLKSGNAESYNKLFSLSELKKTHPKIPQYCSRPTKNSPTITFKIFRIPTYCIRRHLKK